MSDFKTAETKRMRTVTIEDPRTAETNRMKPIEVCEECGKVLDPIEIKMGMLCEICRNTWASNFDPDRQIELSHA